MTGHKAKVRQVGVCRAFCLLYLFYMLRYFICCVLWRLFLFIRNILNQVHDGLNGIMLIALFHCFDVGSLFLRNMLDSI